MRKPIALLVSLVSLCVLAPAGASAATVTIGSPITSPAFAPSECGNACTVVTTGLPYPSALVASPVDGTIVRWRIREADPGAPYALRVLTRSGGEAFTPTATSPAGVPQGPGLETFSAGIPIRAGQMIGLDLAEGAHIGYIGGSSATYAYLEGLAPDGLLSEFDLDDGEIAFNADVQPLPTVGAIGPVRGSIGGGTALTITGTDFAGVTAVSVGGVPARSFAVASESQLTAIAPKVRKPGPVDVVVTTIAGASAPAATKFTYTACVVPRLTGKKLKADRKKLKKAGCRLGNVRGEKSKAAKVVKQFRKPGTILPSGANVGVKVEE